MQEPKRCRNYGRPKSSSLCFVSPSQAKVHTVTSTDLLATCQRERLSALIAVFVLIGSLATPFHRSFLNTWDLESCSSSCR